MNRRTDISAPSDACAFAVPRRLALSTLIAAATGNLAVTTHAGQHAHVRYLDTFDRRLRQSGLVLEHVTLPGESMLRYRKAGHAGAIVEAPAASLPAFARDLAHFRLRSLLSPMLDVRRLLVVAESRGRLTVARCVDSEDKTVLIVECFTAGRGPSRLAIRPLRGYERFAHRVARRLRKIEGLVPDESEPMLVASDGPDSSFGGIPVSARADPDPDERSDVACRRVLERLDASLAMNAPGVEADLDPECLHDFRVATRRARSLLREMKGVFPVAVTRRLRADLGWLGQRTGPVRDLDVHLMEFVDDAGSADRGHSHANAALRDYLEASRKREFRALCHTLRSARYRRLRAALGKFLESEPPVRPQSANALAAVGVLSAARILKVYRRILSEGRAITHDSPPESLHDLRKTCKRLRYLLEFFRDVHPAKVVERTIARLKRLQDNLGTYQDVQVQRAVLETFREHARASLDAAAVDALDTRCAGLAAREKRTRDEFASRFASYDSKRAHKAFRAALRRKRK